MKLCNTCLIEKPESEFAPHDSRGTLRNHCKPCKALKKRKYRADNRELLRSQYKLRPKKRLVRRLGAVKLCRACLIAKPESEFTHAGNGVLSSQCNQCRALAAKQYRVDNRELLRTRKRPKEEMERRKLEERERRASNPELYRGRDRERQHAEKRITWKKAYQPKYFKENKERLLESHRKYRKENWEKKLKQQAIAQARHWRKLNPDRVAARDANRKARVLGAEGHYTGSEFKKLCEFYGNRCLARGKEGKLVPDHVVPLAEGGTNWINNSQPLCHSCNCKKNNKIIDYRTSKSQR